MSVEHLRPEEDRDAIDLPNEMAKGFLRIEVTVEAGRTRKLIAMLSGSAVVYSENMQLGQILEGGIRIENRFG